MTTTGALERWTNNKLVAGLIILMLGGLFAGAKAAVSHDYRLQKVEALAPRVDTIQEAHTTWLEWRARYEEREKSRDEVFKEMQKDVKALLQKR